MSFPDTTPPEAHQHHDPRMPVWLNHSEWGRLEGNLRLMAEDLNEMALEKDEMSDEQRRDLECEASWLVKIADTIDTKRRQVNA